MSDNRKFIQGKRYKLAGSGCAASDTSITVLAFEDAGGTPIVTGDLGTLSYGVLEPKTSRAENISFTGVTDNGDGTYTLTGVTRGLKFKAPYDADANLRQAHAGNTLFILSNTAGFYDNFANKGNDETVSGQWDFTTSPTVPTPTLDTQVASKAYVDGVAIAGAPDASTTTKGIVTTTTATNTVVSTDDARIPTADEKAAIAGQSGTAVSAANKLLDNASTSVSSAASKVPKANPHGLLTQDWLGVPTVTAGEAITAQNLLKLVNNAGVPTVKKIVGFGSAMKGSAYYNNSPYPLFQVVAVDTDKVIVSWYYNSQTYYQVGQIAGGVLTLSAVTSFSLGGYGINLKFYKLANGKVAGLIYQYTGASNPYTVNFYVRAGTISGTTLTWGTDATAYTYSTASPAGEIDGTVIDTDKLAITIIPTNVSSHNVKTVVATFVGTSVSLGAIVDVETDGSYVAYMPHLAQLGTDKYVMYWYRTTSPTSYLHYSVCTVSGTTVTAATPVTTAIPIFGDGGESPTSYPYSLCSLGTDKYLLAYQGTGSTNTALEIRTYFVSGTTVTAKGSTTIASALFYNSSGTVTVDRINTVTLGDFVYLYTAYYHKLYKLVMDPVTGVLQLLLTLVLPGAAGDSTAKPLGFGCAMDALNGDRLVFYNQSVNSSGNYYAELIVGLPDYAEYVGTTDTAYNLNDTFALEPKVGGFSGLLIGQDYYPKPDASGITTYQQYSYLPKLGKAVSATELYRLN